MNALRRYWERLDSKSLVVHIEFLIHHELLLQNIKPGQDLVYVFKVLFALLVSLIVCVPSDRLTSQPRR